MGKLSAPPPRLGGLPSRFSATPNTEHERSRQRDKTQPWRAWYKTARWQKLREAVLKRDSYICQKTGVALIGKYPAPDSPVADHLIPHRGDEALFFDMNNIEAVSKKYHDQEKQRMEHSGRA